MQKEDEEKSTANNSDATENHPETIITTTTATTTLTTDSSATETQTACNSNDAAASAAAIVVTAATDAIDNEIENNATPESRNVEGGCTNNKNNNSNNVKTNNSQNSNKININLNNTSNNTITNNDIVSIENNNNQHIAIPLTTTDGEELPRNNALSEDKKLLSQHTLNEVLRAHSERTSPATAHMQLEPRSTTTTTASSSTTTATANNGDKTGSSNNSNNDTSNVGHSNKNATGLSGIMVEMADDMSAGGGAAAGGPGIGDAATLEPELDNEPTSTTSIRSIGSFVCRICHNAENPERLVSPCFCKGSLTYVHIHCLERWISTSRNTSCELCQFQYNTEQTLRYTCLQSLRMWYSRAMSRRALQEDCQMFSLLTLVAFGIIGTLLVGIQYYFLQGRTWGLGRLWTKGWLVFSLFTTLVVYFVNIYMIVRSQLSPWYRWWQSARDIKLILENRKPLEFRPSRRLQNLPAAEAPPATSTTPVIPQAQREGQQQNFEYQAAASAGTSSAGETGSPQTASLFPGPLTLHFQFGRQFERRMVVATKELGMHNNNNATFSNNNASIANNHANICNNNTNICNNNSNIDYKNVQQNRNKNCNINSNSNIRIHCNKCDYDRVYREKNRINNRHFSKYRYAFLPSTHAASAAGDAATAMPATATAAAADGTSSVGVAAVEILLEPILFSTNSQRL